MQRITLINAETIPTDFSAATIRTHIKPCFDDEYLWYSLNNEWEELCLSDPSYKQFLAPNRFAVQVDESRILKIQTPKESSDFIRRYALDGTEWKINWPEVAKEWAGIEVMNPMALWDHNLNPDSWPWSWDVSSGCVWDPSAILGSTRLEHRAQGEERPSPIITEVENVPDKSESLRR